MSSKAQVLSNNTNSFPNNNSGQITPQVLRDFNADFVNSVQFTDTVTPNATSASFAQTAATASFAVNAANADLLDGLNSTAFVLNSQTASMSVLSASFAATASLLLGTVVSASYAISASQAMNATTATSALTATSASFATTAASATSASFASTASFVQTAQSASFATTATSASFATNALTANSATSATSAASATSASFATTAASASSTPNALVNAVGGIGDITFTRGNGTTFAVVVAVSGSVATASLALNSELLDGLNSTAFVLNSQTSSMSVLSSSFATTASFALNAPKIDTGSFATTSSFNAYTSSNDTKVNALTAATSSYVTNSQTSSMSVASASNAVNAQTSSLAFLAQFANIATAATTASFASTIASGLNITASNILVTNDLVVNGTASFGYTKTTSGSAVMIGDEFIILNADTPVAPFAGIKVYDTGSNSTASFEWNGNGDYWIAVEETGQSSAFLTGASGSKGSEVFPSLNRLTKGTGNNTIIDSSITDNGSTVSINSNTLVTGSLTVTAGITGSLLGTASFASTATSASFASTATSASFASTATSASYALTASFFAGSVVSASYAATASKVSILDDNGNNNHKVTFVNTTVAVGGEQLLIDPTATQFTYNPNTNLLTVTASLANQAVSASFAISASFATSASFAQTAVSASFAPSVAAFPFTGSADISGSLNLIGNAALYTGSLWLENNNTGSDRFFLKSVITESYESGVKNNIWIDRSYDTTQTGSQVSSIEIIGNSNIINATDQGAFEALYFPKVGFSGTGNYVTYLPYFDASEDTIVTGSGTITSTNSFLVNNTAFRPKLSTTSLIIGNSYQGRSATISASGSVNLSNINNQSLLSINNIANATLTVTGVYLAGTNNISTVNSSFNANIQNSFLANVTAYISSSASGNGMYGVGAFGTGLIVSASGASTTTSGMGIVGTYNTADGVTDNVRQTRFLVGTGTSSGARRTSLHVSASGLTTISTGLTVSGSFNVANGITGSLLGTSSFANNAISASYAVTASYLEGSVISASYAATATSASFATNAATAISASFASTSISASFSSTSTSASFASTATSASFSQTAVTASFALTTAGGIQGSEIYSYTFLLMGA